MSTTAVSFCLWLFSLCCTAGEQVPDLKALYERHQWFRLREYVLASPNPPMFYRAAVATAFRHDAAAQSMLRKVMQSAPGSWEAAEAKRLHGLVQLRSELHKSVGKPRPSRLRYSIKLGSLYVPMTINGRKVEYVLDTGAVKSVVSDTEAKRLGLKLYNTEGTVLDGATGGSIPLRHIAVARRLRIGNTQLRDVLFYVFPDDTFFFKGRPPGENGVLGLPAIQALETIRWDSKGNFDVGFPSPLPESAKPNLAFDDERLALEVGFEGNRLIFSLDTGAWESNLWVSFRNQFRELITSAKSEKRKGAGASGVIQYEALVLPELRLQVGGFQTLLHPAEVMLKEELGFGYHGNFGLDLLNQAPMLTIDFRTMRLTLESRGPDPR